MASKIEQPPAARARADATITMRIPARTRALIDSAAAAQGKSRTEFMVESARLHAIDVLLDQRLFALDGGEAEAFAALLASPPPPSEAMRALMAGKAPWE